MGYPVAGTMPGWMPVSHSQQYAYMPMTQPANFSYYPQSSSAPVQNMYSMPASSMPENMHTAVPQSYATHAATNAYAPSVVTAQPVIEEQKNLNASAKSFVPGQSAEKSTGVKPKLPVASSGANLAAGVVDGTGKDAGLTSTHPLFKLPVRRAVRIVDPNAGNAEIETVSKSANSKENAAESEENKEKPKENKVFEETVQDTAILVQEDDTFEEQYVVVEKTDIPEDIASEPVETAEASDNAKNEDEAAMPTADSKETDAAQNDVLEEKAQEPPSLSKNSSRQVTFSESNESNESAKRVLQTDKVVALYSGVDSAPSIVEDILRYPQEFLMQFNGLCTPPPGFNFEIASTDHHSEDRSSGMYRSQSSSHRRESGSMSEFGGVGRFRRSRTDDSFGSSSGRFRQGSSDSRIRTENRFDNRSSSGRRGDRNNECSSKHGRGSDSSRPSPSQQPSSNTAPQLQDVKPLAKSTTGFVPRALRKGGDVVEDEMDEKVFKRRIMALLNIITPDNYNAISDDLIAWGNKSAKETDGRILRKLVQLLVEKTADERTWMKMYANLFLKLISKISNDVQDHNEHSKSGGYLSGGSLVRKYLLQKCQEDFERGWKVDMPEAKQTEEFYDALAIKRRGLGLVELIGELYLLDVLTAHIIKSSLRRMLSNIETPEKEVLESMMKLLSTVGKKLDTLEHKTEVNLYFERIKSMTTNEHLSSRIRLLLMNTIELRKRKWEVRHADEAPKSIAQLHQDMEREKLAKQARSSSGRRNEPNEHRSRRDIGDARNNRREMAQNAGDLSNFGNLSRSKPSIGSPVGNPFSAFASGSRGWRAAKSDEHKNTPARPSPVNTKRTSHSRSANSGSSSPEAIGSQNMFATLMDADESTEHTAYAEKMSTEEVRPLVKNMLTAYVETQNEANLVDNFERLGEANYSSAVYQAVDNIMDRRPDQAEQATNGMAVLAKRGVVSEDLVVAALAEYSGQLEDLLLDVPHAFKFFGMLMAATRIQMSRVPEAMGELMTKVDMLKPPTASIVFAYLKHMAKIDGEESTRKAIAETEFDVSQFLCLDHHSEADIKRVLGLQDLLNLFPKYA
ncbi:hypothetical protein IW148_005632 [Coemansia sp. RSA 1199]|nr:hypothetical protein IW148_005632 [Coemansia sp. RSA 1199]